jgi:hypothetical protein
MAVPRAGMVGGRDGGQLVTDGARGNARAAARRAPAGAKAEAASPVTSSPAGACARPAGRGAGHFARQVTLPRAGSRARGARRAPRAFQDVWKVLTGMGRE